MYKQIKTNKKTPTKTGKIPNIIILNLNSGKDFFHIGRIFFHCKILK